MFNDRPSNASKFVIAGMILVSLCLIFVWSTEGDNGRLHAIQDDFQNILHPISSISTTSSSKNASDASNNASSDQIASLTEQVAKGEEYRQEVERLQGLLSLKDEYGFESVGARVIGKTTDAWNVTVTLDRGTNDGIEVGSTVCASYGVVGQVISTTAGSCVVRLLTDPQSGVACMIQSSRTECIAKGSLEGLITAENIKSDVDVQVGDIVVTSGLGGSFAKGIILGTVVRVTDSTTDGTKTITIKQNDNTSFEECLIIKSMKGENN